MSTARTLAARFFLALAVGLAVYLLTCLLQPPGPLPADGFGHEWSRMSMQPFAFLGQFPQRLLSPLLAHLVGLDGDRYHWFSRLLSGLLLATVFQFCRRRGRAVVDATLVTLAIGVSGAVQIYKGLVGFSDNLTVILLLLSVLVARHGALFWLLLLLNLTNHELVVFFVPWLWFVRWQAGGSWRVDAPSLAAVMALYFGYSRYVGAHAAHQAFNAGFFLENHFLPFGTMWLCVLALVHWVSMFGPLLVVLCWHGAIPRPQHERVHTLLVLLGIAGIFGFAYDVMRHANILCVPLVIASSRLLEDRRARLPYALLVLAAIASTLWLGLPVGTGGGVMLKSITDTLLPCSVFVVEPPGILHIDNGRMFACVLPQIWGRLVLCAGALLLFALCGRWLQQRGNAAGADHPPPQG